ncbi:MAG: inositol 2-dehydrogenase [Actinomycetota bacterium]|nr:inositol 2-dehydrogenase [Actinomycetota bacterium]
METRLRRGRGDRGVASRHQHHDGVERLRQDRLPLREEPGTGEELAREAEDARREVAERAHIEAVGELAKVWKVHDLSDQAAADDPDPNARRARARGRAHRFSLVLVERSKTAECSQRRRASQPPSRLTGKDDLRNRPRWKGSPTRRSRRERMSVGVAILGAGRMGRLHAENIVKDVPRLRVVAFAEPEESVAEAAVRELGIPVVRGWRDLVARRDVAAVLVCSPPDAHVEQVAAAAEAGKHVFCEKPLAPDLSSIDRALEVASRSGVVLQVGFNRRFDRNFARVRDEVRAGRVGDPCVLRVTSRDPEPPAASYLPVSGGLFLDMAIHDFDLARFVLGAEILEVTALADALVDTNARELGDVDTAVTSLRFDNAALGVIDNCRRSAYGYDQRVEVHGSSGMVAAGNELATTSFRADETGFHSPVLPHFFLDRYRVAYVRELESFARAVDGAPVEASGDDARQATLAAMAAKRAHEERRAVPLREVA